MRQCPLQLNPIAGAVTDPNTLAQLFGDVLPGPTSIPSDAHFANGENREHAGWVCCGTVPKRTYHRPRIRAAATPSLSRRPGRATRGRSGSSTADTWTPSTTSRPIASRTGKMPRTPPKRSFCGRPNRSTSAGTTRPSSAGSSRSPATSSPTVTARRLPPSALRLQPLPHRPEDRLVLREAALAVHAVDEIAAHPNVERPVVPRDDLDRRQLVAELLHQRAGQRR